MWALRDLDIGGLLGVGTVWAPPEEGTQGINQHFSLDMDVPYLLQAPSF